MANTVELELLLVVSPILDDVELESHEVSKRLSAK